MQERAHLRVCMTSVACMCVCVCVCVDVCDRVRARARESERARASVHAYDINVHQRAAVHTFAEKDLSNLRFHGAIRFVQEGWYVPFADARHATFCQKTKLFKKKA